MTEESLLKIIDVDSLLQLPGDKSLQKRRFLGLPFHHLTVFGGWRSYFVLEPESESQDFWVVGWVVGDYSGISKVKLKGRVRVLKGDSPAKFFGVSSAGRQIKVRLVAEVSLGDGGEYGKIPLL
jgi:hypothetical protein